MNKNRLVYCKFSNDNKNFILFCWGKRNNLQLKVFANNLPFFSLRAPHPATCSLSLPFNCSRERHCCCFHLQHSKITYVCAHFFLVLLHSLALNRCFVCRSKCAGSATFILTFIQSLRCNMSIFTYFLRNSAK